jgi:hypothetical protein
MESKEVKGLMEAYYSIYEGKEEPEMEEGEEKEEEEHKGKKKEKKEKEEKEKKEEENDEEEMKESADLFDYILEHLVAEGYADTNQAALAIMANMSEEWKQDIVEAKYGTEAGRKKLAKKIRKGEEIGKSGPGTGFKAVEKAAEKGGAEDPKAVAAAAMWKTHGGKKG